MKLYLVTADTWDEGYGAEIYCFGIAKSEEELKKIEDYVRSMGFTPNVEEIKPNTNVKIYLGGYCE